MALLNINGSVDAFYRYKMPALDLAYQRSKTTIVNIAAVAAALKRPIRFIQKYLSNELGTAAKLESNQLVLGGRYTAAVLKAAVAKFIALIVICQTCCNPETTLIVKRQQVRLDCQACGNISSLSTHRHKLVKYICNEYKPKKRCSEPKCDDTPCESALEDWSCDTSAEAVAERSALVFGTHRPASKSPVRLEVDDDFIVFSDVAPVAVVDVELQAFIDTI
jgi:putative translation initiation factor aIF-2 beta subunit